MSYESLVTGLLLPDEAILWASEAEKGPFRKMAPHLFAVIGCVLVGSGLWSIWESFFSSPVAVRDVPYVQIISSSAVGFFCLWVGISGKTFVPQPWYGLTQRRVLIAREDRYRPPTVLARFLEPNRAVQVAEHGYLFNLTVPVVPEASADPGLETLNGLSRTEKDRALAVINTTLGMSAQ